ncbi:MAG: hypothetical protein ACTS3F_04570 [Phycisphaerales bacterium]
MEPHDMQSSGRGAGEHHEPAIPEPLRAAIRAEYGGSPRVDARVDRAIDAAISGGSARELVRHGARGGGGSRGADRRRVLTRRIAAWSGSLAAAAALLLVWWVVAPPQQGGPGGGHGPQGVGGIGGSLADAGGGPSSDAMAMRSRRSAGAAGDGDGGAGTSGAGPASGPASALASREAAGLDELAMLGDASEVVSDPRDVNADERIDILDAMALAMRLRDGGMGVDINGDGVVDGRDVDALALGVVAIGGS